MCSSNQQQFNFGSFKEQVLDKALSVHLDRDDFEEQMVMQNKRPRIEKLVLHSNKTIMGRKKFEIVVEENRGNILNLSYDKQRLLNPNVEYKDVTCVDTLNLPCGRDSIHTYEYNLKNDIF